MTVLEFIKISISVIGCIGGFVGVISLLYTVFRNKRQDDKEIVQSINEMKNETVGNGIKLTQVINSVGDIRVDIKTMDGKVQSLSERIAVLESSIKTFNDRLAGVENTNNSLMQNYLVMQEEIETLKRERANIEREIDNLKRGA